jgi:DNA-binding beta-propeller fold protein YncE
VLGTLTAPAPAHSGAGAIEVLTSPDGRYAFVSIEYGDEIAVFDLRAALASGFATSGFVGAVALGSGVVGMALSPDGRWLYATSQRPAGGGPATVQGTLSVIDLAAAEHDPAHAVVATAAAGCQPVRVVVSSDGRTVWVAARASDAVLAFSAAALRSDPRHALLAAVRVGEAPIGLALLAGGRRMVVADSNRFGAAGVSAQLTVVNPAAALAGRPAVLGSLPSGAFPRELSLEPGGGTLLLSEFLADRIEAVDVASLP